MHLEIIVEDSSGEKLLESILPKIIGPQGGPHTWRMHSYKGVGRIPNDLKGSADPKKRVLLDRLPALLRGFGKTAGIDGVVVVIDTDRRDCAAFLKELQEVAHQCSAPSQLLFRLAIEEIEAWYLGDSEALRRAYPKAKSSVLKKYVQDSVCGTWEILADAVYPGGSASVKKSGWPLPGQLKHRWAAEIGPQLDPERNCSPSFQKLVGGLKRFVSQNSKATSEA